MKVEMALDSFAEFFLTRSFSAFQCAFPMGESREVGTAAAAPVGVQSAFIRKTWLKVGEPCGGHSLATP